MNKDKYLHLFSCCVPVKGAKRSIVIDFQRKKVELIPNALYEIITDEFNVLSVGQYTRNIMGRRLFLMNTSIIYSIKNFVLFVQKKKKNNFLL